MTDLDADSAGLTAAKTLRAAGAEIVTSPCRVISTTARATGRRLRDRDRARAQATIHRVHRIWSGAAGLIDMGRRLPGLEIARLQVRRAAPTGGLTKLLATSIS